VAAVGLVWSQRNTDFYGRDDTGDLVDLPYRGMMQALVRARIPYIPVHADYIERDSPELAVLALPNLGAMSDAQCDAVRRFTSRGGSVIATGATSLYDEWGDARPDFALADLFGAHASAEFEKLGQWAGRSFHTYLRLAPELRARVFGPKAGDEPPATGQRHPVLDGFEETDILPFGGMLPRVRTDPGVVIPLTFVPPFPVYPPETAWMREPKTDIPGLVLRNAGSSRIAYLPADIDRRFARENLSDHGNLLANLFRWAGGGNIPLAVEGPGLVDCNLYRQPGRLILHVVNLTSAGTWRAPIDELIPIGPFRLRVRLSGGASGRNVRLLVARKPAAVKVAGGWAEFEIASILDHEVAVIE